MAIVVKLRTCFLTFICYQALHYCYSTVKTIPIYSCNIHQSMTCAVVIGAVIIAAAWF